MFISPDSFFDYKERLGHSTGGCWEAASRKRGTRRQEHLWFCSAMWPLNRIGGPPGGPQKAG